MALAFYLTGFKDYVVNLLGKIYDLTAQTIKKGVAGFWQKIGERIKQGIEEEGQEMELDLKEKISDLFNSFVDKIKSIF